MNKLQVDLLSNLETEQIRKVEQDLIQRKGIDKVTIADRATIQIQWDASKTSQSEVIRAINAFGLSIQNIEADSQPLRKPDHDDHAYLNFLGENTELYFAVTSGIFWILGVIFYFIGSFPNTFSTTFYIIAALFGGVFSFF